METRPNTTYSILDDEAFDSSSLHSLIKRSFPNLTLDKIYQFPRPSLNDIVERQPDILFLDVEMPEIGGIEFYQMLKARNFKSEVIFTTFHDQYAIDALREYPCDYLLKPIGKTKLKHSLERYYVRVKKTMSGLDRLHDYGLSKRELEVAERLLMTMTSIEIGEDLFISENTVNTHRRNILKKTGLKNTIELFNLVR